MEVAAPALWRVERRRRSPPRRPASARAGEHSADEPLRERQLAFGYTQEDLRVLLAPLVRDGKEPTGSMGNDLSLAVFSEHQPSLFAYFKQRFAQVTNPAIDSVREHMVMSLEPRSARRATCSPKAPTTRVGRRAEARSSPTPSSSRCARPITRSSRRRRSTSTWALADGTDGLADRARPPSAPRPTRPSPTARR